MALNENILGQQIYTVLTTGDPSQTKELCTSLAKAIVDHIKQNGEVSVAVVTNTGSGTGTGTMS